MFSQSATKKITSNIRGDSPLLFSAYHRQHIGVILLYGDKNICKTVALSFAKQQIKTKYFSDIAKLAHSVDQNSVAAIFVEPVPDMNTLQTVKDFKKMTSSHNLALFALASIDKTSEATRELYGQGLLDVFKWTAHTDLMPKLVSQHLLLSKSGRGLTPQDRRLSRAVMNRVKIIAGVGREVKISVRNGKAHIFGKLKSLKKKSKIEDIIFSTPGITDVVTKSVVIPITRKLDRELSQKILSKLRLNPSVKEGSLSIEVTNCIATISGTTSDKNEMTRILTTAGSVEHIHSISNLMVVSKEQAENDHTLAKKAKNIISRYFIHSNINVSIIKNTAFITGKVDLADKKPFASTLLKQHLNQVKNIVNKITII